MSDRQIELLIERQIGRVPQIPFRVAARCTYGWPAVIKNEPLGGDGAPNPNLYYLTCPYLRYQMAVLEDKGYIAKLEEIVGNDEFLAAKLRKAQASHAAEWTLEAGVDWPCGQTGSPRIAAASGELSIKCLHAHAAWYLIDEEYDPGRLILDWVGERWCDDERCEKYDIGEQGGG